jgi:hypothetical protein
MTDPVADLLRSSREHLAQRLGRPLPAPHPGSAVPLTEAEARHLQGEGESLYWNDLEWEGITDEESLDSGPLAELTFPGFLAFVRGLLLEEVMPDSQAPADPRPEAVEALLGFLAGRVVRLRAGGEGGEGSSPQLELRLAERLIELVLALLHRIPAAELEGRGAGAHPD